MTDIKQISGGVCAPQGFTGAGIPLRHTQNHTKGPRAHTEQRPRLGGGRVNDEPSEGRPSGGHQKAP